MISWKYSDEKGGYTDHPDPAIALCRLMEIRGITDIPMITEVRVEIEIKKLEQNAKLEIFSTEPKDMRCILKWLLYGYMLNIIEGRNNKLFAVANVLEINLKSLVYFRKDIMSTIDESSNREAVVLLAAGASLKEVKACMEAGTKILDLVSAVIMAREDSVSIEDILALA